MPSATGRPSPHYRIFILSLWADSGSLPGQPASWRCSLEEPHSGRRLGFANLDELLRYFDSQTQAWTRSDPEEMT